MHHKVNVTFLLNEPVNADSFVGKVALACVKNSTLRAGEGIMVTDDCLVMLYTGETEELIPGINTPQIKCVPEDRL